MPLQRRDVEMDQRSREMELSIYGKEGYEMVEGVTHLKYMGIPLDQSDNNWPLIHWKIRRLRNIWGRLVKILRGEEIDTHVSENFYRVLLQAVLLLGL